MTKALDTANATDVAFDAFEIAGWHELSTTYHENLGPLTSRAVDAVLAAAQPRDSDRLLDVGTGPGYVAAIAAERGLDVTGCDVSPAMLTLARKLHPSISFDIADARDLPYRNREFGIVTASFVLLHTALPDLMTAEAVRVLRPGGSFVASVYDEPGRARFAAVFAQAMANVELTPPRIPHGPGLFELSSRDKLAALLREGGLVDVDVQVLELEQDITSPAALFDIFARSTVRARAILEVQSDETRRQILGELAAALAPYRSGNHYSVPVAFLVASGRKPTEEPA
jgi:SAM-dependent methyltransferase